MNAEAQSDSGDGRRTILVTGAAAGIGATTARLFAERGWFVGLFDIDTDGVAALRGELGEGNAVDGHLDVTDADSWQAALAKFTGTTGGRLDVLFNNAGVIAAGPLADVPVERHRGVIDVNVTGVLNGCHAAHPYLKRTPDSRVINMASASAIYGQPDIASYSASKFAVRGLTEALDLEWRQDDIRVAAIWPLWVKTALADAADESATTETLGVRLEASDVADAVWKATNSRRRPPKTHWIVGGQTRVLSAAAHVAPPAATRWLVGRLSRR